jgi:MFS transporter, DHA1 family, inner membrane transport protein
MPLALFALFAGAFSIGTSEFVIAGILPTLSDDLGVSIPTAGLLVSLYAFGVAIGGPLLAAFTGRVNRRMLLITYVSIFTVGYVACALAPNYAALLAARLAISMIHGAYFGTALVLTSSLAPKEKTNVAVALVLAGLTVANVVGVPFGAAIGNAFGWRMTFWVVAALGALSLIAIIALIPSSKPAAGQSGNFLAEIKVLGREPVYSSLLVIVFTSMGQFAIFTYIAPVLIGVSGVSAQAVPAILVAFGVGSTIGVLVGGRLADWNLMGTLITVLAAQVVTYLLMVSFVGYAWPMAALVLVWGALAFAFGAPVQSRIISNTTDAPLLASSLIPSAFNISIAAGAFFGGVLIENGTPYAALPWAGALGAAGALAIAVLSFRKLKRASA